MKRKNHIAAAVTVVTSLLSGCGSMDLKKNGKKANENDYHLAGKWQGPCTANSTGQWPFYKRNLQFNVIGDFEASITFFNDKGCIDKVVSHLESGTYSSLSESKTEEGSRDINFTVFVSSIKPELQTTANDFNSEKFCALEKWENQKPQSILGSTCGGIMREKGEVIYNTYRFSDSHKRLALGKESIFLNGEAKADRPKKTEDGVDFVKE